MIDIREKQRQIQSGAFNPFVHTHTRCLYLHSASPLLSDPHLFIHTHMKEREQSNCYLGWKYKAQIQTAIGEILFRNQ